MLTGKDQAAWYNDPPILILWLTHFADPMKSFEEMWSEDEANENCRRLRNKGVTSKIRFSSHNSLRGIQSIQSIQSDISLQSPIKQYSLFPWCSNHISPHLPHPLACDSQFENTPGYLRAIVNLKILLDTRVRQSIWKYSWTPACDSQFENTPWPPRSLSNGCFP